MQGLHFGWYVGDRGSTSYISDGLLSHALVEVGGGARAEFLVGRVRTFHKTHAHNNTQKAHKRHAETLKQTTCRKTYRHTNKQLGYTGSCYQLKKAMLRMPFAVRNKHNTSSHRKWSTIRYSQKQCKRLFLNLKENYICCTICVILVLLHSILGYDWWALWAKWGYSGDLWAN